LLRDALQLEIAIRSESERGFTVIGVDAGSPPGRDAARSSGSAPARAAELGAAWRSAVKALTGVG
jgi:hypothetical protein